MFEVTEAHLANVDRDRLVRGRVRAEFVAVWREAERRYADERLAELDWRLEGIVQTCRWVAHAPWRGRTNRLPATGGIEAPMPETMESETAEASVAVRRARRLMETQRGDSWELGRLEGVLATLRWLWRDSQAPLDV